MVEGDSKSETAEPVTNGTKSPEKEVPEVVDKDNGVKTMEDEKKEDTDVKVEDKTVAVGEGEKADEVKDTKEDKEDKEESMEDKVDKEEPNAEAMEVEKSSNEIETDVEMAEKTEGLEEKKDDGKENGGDMVKEEEEAKETGNENEKEEVEESGKEKEDKNIEEKEEPNGSKVEKSSKKRSRGKGAERKEGDKKQKVVQKEQEPRSPTSDRPVRERKSVERLVATIEKDNSKEFQIEKGRGTPLKDIPNVAYKLSRKKNEETFKLLHMILYGRQGKANQIKHNVSRFSGFVWHDNEEKRRLKIKEKLDKTVKEKLLEFCDVLDIPITKATSRKEDIVVKLLDFLVEPHATTTELLAEKDQGKKRKRSATNGASASASPKGSSKSRKKTGDSSTKRKKPTPESDDESQDDEANEDGKKENGVAESSEDEKSEQSDSEDKKDVSENESEEDAPQKKVSAGKAKIETKKNSPALDSLEKAARRTVVTPRKARSVLKGTPKKSSVNSSKVESADKSPKVFSRKKKEEEPKNEKSSASKKSVTKEKSATKEKPAPKEKSASKEKPVAKDKSGKKAGKGKEKTKDKLKPSDDELKNAICDILKEVDFNTATFTDILKQLAKQFKSDLAPRKSAIKLMIQDELTKLAEEAEDEDEEDEGDAKKNDTKPASKEVEA